MADPVVSIAIDLDGDGDFSETSEEILPYVIRAKWKIGLTRAFDAIARDSTCTIILDNTSSCFSPEHASALSGFREGRAGRIQIAYGGSTQILFVGWIKSGGIKPAPGLYGPQTTQVEFDGWLQRIQKSQVGIPLQEGKRANEIISTIIGAAAIYPPGFTGYWLMGRGRVGTTTRLGGTTTYFSAEEGKTIFEYEADWEKGVSAYTAIKAVVEREGGRLFVDRGGRVVFWNRHHLVVDRVSAVDASFSDDMISIGYLYPTHEIANRIIAKYKIRKVSAAEEILCSVDKTQELAPGDTSVSFTYRATDSGAKISGKNVLVPVGGTDFIAKNADGLTMTNYVTARVSKESSSGCTVVFTNSYSAALILQSGYQVRGIKITDYVAMEAQYSDEDSINDLRAIYPFTVPGVFGSLAEAEGMAKHHAVLRKIHGVVTHLAIAPYISDQMMQYALDLTMGDRIRIAESKTGTDKDYFVIGEEWELLPGMMIAAKKIVEPSPETVYWQMGRSGFSNVGVSTRPYPI